MEKFIEKFIGGLNNYLGDHANEYSLKASNGQWWIEHKEVGSGEPLNQVIKSIKIEPDQTTELVNKVKEMRYLQKEFFKNKDYSVLAASKLVEKQVDRMISELETNQQSLF